MKQILFFILILFSFSCTKDKINLSGVSSESFLLKQDSCYCSLPNSFSPDGNGNNDVLAIFSQGLNTTGYELTIRNKRQKILFQTTDISKTWDGHYKGKRQKVGQYIATIKGKFSCGQSFEENHYICLFYDCIDEGNQGEFTFSDMFDPITGQYVYPTSEKVCD